MTAQTAWVGAWREGMGLDVAGSAIVDRTPRVAWSWCGVMPGGGEDV